MMFYEYFSLPSIVASYVSTLSSKTEFMVWD